MIQARYYLPKVKEVTELVVVHLMSLFDVDK
jgi:hypothetical protein